LPEYEVFEPTDEDVAEFGKEALAAAFSDWCSAVSRFDQEGVMPDVYC